MAAERILTVNVGSSSVKLRLVDGGAVVRSWDFAPAVSGGQLAAAAAEARRDAVAHRFVHGGP